MCKKVVFWAIFQKCWKSSRVWKALFCSVVTLFSNANFFKTGRDQNLFWLALNTTHFALVSTKSELIGNFCMHFGDTLKLKSPSKKSRWLIKYYNTIFKYLLQKIYQDFTCSFFSLNRVSLRLNIHKSLNLVQVFGEVLRIV